MLIIGITASGSPSAIPPPATTGIDLGEPSSWNIADSVNTTVGGTGDRDATLGDVSNNTGIRSIKIPRTGKVYFEIYIIAAGDVGFGNAGIRKLIGSDPVGDNVFAGEPLAEPEAVYWANNNLYKDSQVNVSTPAESGFIAQYTGMTHMIAIDWDTGNCWFGQDGLWDGDNGGTNPISDPSTLFSPSITINTTVEWGAWATGIGAVGNQQYRIVDRIANFAYTMPAGFNAWGGA